MRTRTTQALRRCHDVIWALTAGTSCAMGLLVAVGTSGSAAVASLLVTPLILAAMVVVAARLTELEWRVRPILVGAVVCGLVLVVMMGLTRALGPVSYVVVSMLLLASPLTRDAVRRVLGGRAGRPASVITGVPMPQASSQPPRPLPDDPAFSVPDEMTVVDLCQVWRSSYVALERATSPESRLRVVKIRAIYLDELERRAGPAMHAWLRSGPRAAGDPTRWLTPKASNDPLRALLR